MRAAACRIWPASSGDSLLPSASGKFTLSTFDPGDGAVTGTHAVAVIVNATVSNETVSLIDEKYREPATSGLTVTIDGPTDDLKIELVGGLRKPPAAANQATGDVPAAGL